jgi:tetratricopeptide (TPR) repeat protein
MPNETSVQPKLGDLLARYLEKQADAQAAGITTFDGEVTPYEVGPLQPLDPKLAWDEALAVLAFYGKPSSGRRQAPPHWAQLVSGHESIVAIAFSVGNFPQLVRNFHQVLTQPSLTEIQPNSLGGRAAAVDLSAYVAEAGQKRQFPHLLVALGALRLARQFDAAQDFIAAQDASIPAEWRNAWENEKAAVAWHAGRFEEARKIWDQLEPTAPVLFNRGMAALFARDVVAAKQHLNAAIAQLPASSAWHHLGRLYLTLAELRR